MQKNIPERVEIDIMLTAISALTHQGAECNTVNRYRKQRQKIMISLQ